MPELTSEAQRIAYTRRLWGLVLGEDVVREVAARMLGVSSVTWGRWESEGHNIGRDNLQRIAEKSAELGLPQITPAWLAWGEGEGPPMITVTPVAPRARHIKKRGKVVRPGDAKADGHRRRA
jgi:hypothetical protein